MKKKSGIKPINFLSILGFMGLMLSTSLILPCGAKAETRIYTLEANDAGGIVIPVNEGDVVIIQASGRVHTFPGGTVAGCDVWTGPSGLSNCIYLSQQPELNRLPFMALVGTLNGKKMYIGANQTIRCDSDGELVLFVNDWVHNDNAGSFRVRVTK